MAELFVTTEIDDDHSQLKMMMQTIRIAMRLKALLTSSENTKDVNNYGLLDNYRNRSLIIITVPNGSAYNSPA
jgi:hypothetical protein